MHLATFVLLKGSSANILHFQVPRLMEGFVTLAKATHSPLSSFPPVLTDITSDLELNLAIGTLFLLLYHAELCLPSGVGEVFEKIRKETANRLFVN